MNKKIMMFVGCLLTLLTACTEQKEINLLSYNVRNCIGMDKVRDYQRVADAINAIAPDVVALQELDSVSRRNGGVYALDSLMKLTGMHGVYVSAIPFQGGGYGIGILSKEEPLGYKTFPMPGREEQRALIVAEFKDYVFACTHQSLTKEDQVLAVPQLYDALKGYDKPVFLAGDMNALPADPSQELLAAHFITLNNPAALTFPADVPDRCLDYIYAYKQNGYQFEVVKAEVIDEPAASDHRPVQVIVKVKK